MKTLLLSLIILILPLELFSQFNEPFLNRSLKEKNRLFNKDQKLRKFIDYEYQALDDGKLGDLKNFKVVQFDSDGNIKHVINYDRQKKITSYQLYVYNDKNEKLFFYEFDMLDLLYKTSYFYDLNNELIESVKETKFGSVNSKRRYYYNGNKIKRIETTGPSGKSISVEKPEYNAEGWPVRSDEGNLNEILKEIRIEYKDGLIIKDKYKDFDEEMIITNVYIYKNGLIDTIKVEHGVDNETFEIEKSSITRLYKRTDDELNQFENSFKIPDFSKYTKKETHYHQHYTYKTPPEFPGGKKALIKYIHDNLKYPKKALKAGIQGLVIVSFVIDASGSVGNIRVNKAVEYEIDDAAVELVKKMPKWKPALNEKEKGTMSSFILPINFIIE